MPNCRRCIFFGIDAFTIFNDLAGFAGAINATTEADLDIAGECLASAVAKIGVDAVMTLLTSKVADEIGKGIDNVNQVDEVTASSDDDLIPFDEVKYPEGTSVREDLPKHLKDFDGINSSGVSGTHNLDVFEQAVKDEGLQIVSKTEHPNVKGIYEIKYKVPKQDGSGEFRAKDKVKTVYDPAIHLDEKIVELGQRAAAQGMDEAIAKGNSQFNSTVEDISFRVYLDLETNQITNVHPRFQK
jgi:copper chaperone CopZ